MNEFLNITIRNRLAIKQYNNIIKEIIYFCTTIYGDKYFSSPKRIKCPKKYYERKALEINVSISFYTNE